MFISRKRSIAWPDPTQEMLNTPEFDAIWNCIKTWDINVPEVHDGYCPATGSHVRAILDALHAQKVPPPSADPPPPRYELVNEHGEVLASFPMPKDTQHVHIYLCTGEKGDTLIELHQNSI